MDLYLDDSRAEKMLRELRYLATELPRTRRRRSGTAPMRRSTGSRTTDLRQYWNW